MANYMATARTNYFRVTDEKRYAELFKGLCSEGEVYDFTEEKDGVIYHGFGSYDSITWVDDDDECSCRSANLHLAASEHGDNETGNDSGDNSFLWCYS